MPARVLSADTDTLMFALSCGSVPPEDVTLSDLGFDGYPERAAVLQVACDVASVETPLLVVRHALAGGGRADESVQRAALRATYAAYLQRAALRMPLRRALRRGRAPRRCAS
jgi:hypothetical protein